MLSADDHGSGSSRFGLVGYRSHINLSVNTYRNNNIFANPNRFLPNSRKYSHSPAKSPLNPRQISASHTSPQPNPANPGPRSPHRRSPAGHPLAIPPSQPRSQIHNAAASQASQEPSQRLRTTTDSRFRRSDSESPTEIQEGPKQESPCRLDLGTITRRYKRITRELHETHVLAGTGSGRIPPFPPKLLTERPRRRETGTRTQNQPDRPDPTEVQTRLAKNCTDGQVGWGCGYEHFHVLRRAVHELQYTK